MGYIKDKESYAADIDLFIGMSAFSFVLCFAVQQVDRRRRGILAMSADQLRGAANSII